MTFRFEEEDFKNVYVLEDYYCTNPFCDCDHVTLSFFDAENEGRISFLFNLNKTFTLLPNQPKPSTVQTEIIKRFVKDMQEELFVLLKQRYMEAKAYGEKNPMSYLVFEPGRYVNYLEMVPKNSKLLDFSYEGEKYFTEDSYDMDPRTGNKDIRLAFFKLEMKSEKHLPVFNYTYCLDEEAREAADGKLGAKESDILEVFNKFIPNLQDILKARYKEAKQIGKQLMETRPRNVFDVEKPGRNDDCSCGSGKKYKKCCALKLN